MELARGAETPRTILLVQQAEQIGPEEDFPNPGWLGLQPDDFPAEGAPDEPLAALPKEPAIGTDATLAPRGRIVPSRQGFWQRSQADAIMSGGRLQAQRFVRTNPIIVGPPAVGAPLVCARMRGGVVGDFGLIDAVHLFVRRVVFRMRGPAKLDLDAQAPPPDREARKPAWADPAERWPVVHADDFGQAVTSKHACQRAPGVGIALVGQQPDIQEETAFEIAHGQRFDPRAVAGMKPAFEIQRPDVVGNAGGSAFAGRQLRSLPLVARSWWHQFEAAQPPGQRAGRGQMHARMELPQPGPQFPWPPSWLAAAELAQGRLPAPRQLPWRTVWATGTIPQTGTPVAAEAMHPLVTAGAGDVETVTELRKGFTPRQSREDEPFTCGKQRASKPRHARSVRPSKASECPRCPGRALSTMSCHRASRVQPTASRRRLRLSIW